MKSTINFIFYGFTNKLRMSPKLLNKYYKLYVNQRQKYDKTTLKQGATCDLCSTIYSRFCVQGVVK